MISITSNILGKGILPARQTLGRRATQLTPRRLAHSASSRAPRPTNRPWALRSLAAASLAIGSYGVGSFYPPQIATILSPPIAPPSPSADSIEGRVLTEAIENSLQTLPLVQSLRKQSDKYYETRPYSSIPEERRVHSLTAGSLRGPGKLAVPPVLFATLDDSESTAIIHVGRSLCGHDGIIHGGLLATLLDEVLARTAIVNLPGKVGVTANLSVNYRAPTRADQFIVVTTKLEELKGRKAVVVGRVEDMDGNLLVDASAIFVEPKYAKLLNTKGIEQVLGKRPDLDQKSKVPQEAAL